MNLQRSKSLIPWSALLFSAICATATSATGAEYGKNLLKNGGAEIGEGSDGGTVASIPKWTSEPPFTVVQYGAPGFPDAGSAGAPKRGTNFFSGGPSNEQSSATQTISLEAFAQDIDAGIVKATLSGYLGGFGSQDDQADVRLDFLDATGQITRTISLAPVSASERNNLTGFVKRTWKTRVPPSTRSAVVKLTMSRAAGSNYNDGYADALSLIVRR